MSKICITTVVDKEYMAYLPLFVYCVNKAYPTYHVKLFLRDKCPYDLSGLRCDLVPLFESFPRYKYASIALRFAIDKKHFKEFDYVYTTDIDMMIMPEDPDLEYFHRTEMESTGLCYSNSLRNFNHYEGERSLTGLHFASREWYEKTNDLAAEYRENLRRGLLGVYREYDGLMLYRLAKDAGCGLPGKYRLTNRHHGIHLGNFRIFGENRLKLETRIPSPFVTRWLTYLSAGKFRNMHEQSKVDDSEARENLVLLERFARGEM